MVQIFPTSALASVNCFINPINGNSWKRFVNTTLWMWPVIFRGSCLAPVLWVPRGDTQFSFSVEIFKCPFLLLRKEMGGGGGGGGVNTGSLRDIWALCSSCVLFGSSSAIFYIWIPLSFSAVLGWCKTRSQHGTNLYISKEEFQSWLVVQ